jgi:hemerythrin superfamily protein
MDMTTPSPLSAEHGEIHDRLSRAAREPGAIGEAAQRVARYFSQHAEKEERLVFPLLALLPVAAHNKIDVSMAEELPRFAQLEALMPDMLAEHHMISAALEKLLEAARAQDRAEFAALAAHVLNHSKLEEAVIYPALLLLGKFLRRRFGLG